MDTEAVEFLSLDLASWFQRNVYTLDVDLLLFYLARHMYNLFRTAF